MAVQEHASHSDTLLVVAIGALVCGLLEALGLLWSLSNSIVTKHTTQYGVNGVYL